MMRMVPIAYLLRLADKHGVYRGTCASWLAIPLRFLL